MRFAPPLGSAAKARVALPFAIVCLIWGSTWLVIRDQLGVVPPGWSVAYRFAIAGAALAAFAAWRGERLRLTAPEQAVAVLLGLTQFVLNFNFVYLAEGRITSGLVALIYALLMVPNALFGRLLLGQTVSRPFLAGSAVAIVGIGLLFRHELASAPPAATGTVLAGIGFGLAGVLSASAANIVQAGERAKTAPLTSMIAWAMFWGVLLNAVLAWVVEGPPVGESRPGYWAGLLYLGLAGSALTFPLYFGLIRAIGAARAAYTGVLIPVVAMALSTAFEGYLWSVEAAFGAGLVMVGLVVAMRARRPAR